jgi:hypothetical protein
LRVAALLGTLGAMDKATRGTDMVKRIGRLVEGFLTDLAETAPDDLDCLALERSIMTVVCDLALSMMKEVFQQADEQAPEVLVHGSRWGNRAVSKGTYTTKFGTLTLDRSGYQQAGRGRVLFPVDLRLGIVEGRYTPGMARVMAQTIAQMPAEEGEAYLEELGLGRVSKSTLHRIPQDMAALYERDRVAIEQVIRGESRVPEGTHTVQVAMDGVMVPMDGEDIKPRGRKTTEPQPPRHERHYGVTAPSPADNDGKQGVAYHEASVGTLSFFNAKSEHLGTVYAARMPQYRKETLSATLEAELSAVLQDCPTVQVALASDGAVTHWEHLDGMQQRLPKGTSSRQLLDFCHGAKYLFDAAKLVEPDEGNAMAMAEEWRGVLRHRLDGPNIVLRALRYQRDACEPDDDRREDLDTIIDFFATHKQRGRLAYKAAANDAFPIGTGTTEAAAKTLVNVRMKRAGARYTPHGGQTILCFRSALLSGRFDITMREIIKRYTAEVRAA